MPDLIRKLKNGKETKHFLALVTCSRHQSLQKFEFELTKSFVMISLMILQQTI